MHHANSKLQHWQTPCFGFQRVKCQQNRPFKIMKEHGPHICGDLKTLRPIYSAWKLSVKCTTKPCISTVTHWYHLCHFDKLYMIQPRSCSVTCTSSPCSRLLCCTRPSICGTYLKLSPLNRALSGRYKQDSCSRQRYASHIKKNMFTVLQLVLTLYNCRTWFSRNTFVSVYSLSPKGSGYATHKA